MKLEGRVALMGLQFLPEIIADRVSKDTRFLEYTGLRGFKSARFGTFDHGAVVAALRLASSEDRSVTVSTDEGRKLTLSRTAEGVLVSSAGDAANETLLPYLGLLDPDLGVRRAALRAVIDDPCHPVPANMSAFQTVADEGPLNERDLGRLSDRIARNPWQVLGGIERKWRSGAVNITDLIPSDPSYYEDLVGLVPDNATSVDEYVSTVLQERHKAFVTQDIRTALIFGCPAAIRPDISIALLLAHESDESVWTAIQSTGPTETPFALLDILRLLLPRCGTDARLSQLTAETMDRLSSPQLIGTDGQDAYELLPALIRLCLRWISTQAGFTDAPAYWRILAAHVHGHLLLGVIRHKEINTTEFTGWCDGHLTNEMLTTEALDFAQQPLWRPNELNAMSLRMEVLGRLNLIVTESEKVALLVPNRDRFEKSLSDLPQGAVLYTVFPGPLEGHLRRNGCAHAPSTTRQDIAESFDKLVGEIQEDAFGEGWLKMAANAHLFSFDEPLASRLNALAQNIKVPFEAEKRHRFFKVLECISFISASQPHEALAETVASKLTEAATKFQSAREVDAGYLLLLSAAAAIPDRGRSLLWLEEKFTQYAFALPRGTASARLHSNLKVLTSLLPLDQWRFAKARMIAACALS